MTLVTSRRFRWWCSYLSTENLTGVSSLTQSHLLLVSSRRSLVKSNSTNEWTNRGALILISPEIWMAFLLCAVRISSTSHFILLFFLRREHHIMSMNGSVGYASQWPTRFVWLTREDTKMTMTMPKWATAQYEGEDDDDEEENESRKREEKKEARRALMLKDA